MMQDKLDAEKRTDESSVSSSATSLKGLLQICPICGKEFSCNKSYHVYTALVGRRRQYYCSYKCYKQRPHPKIKHK